MTRFVRKRWTDEPNGSRDRDSSDGFESSADGSRGGSRGGPTARAFSAEHPTPSVSPLCAGKRRTRSRTSGLGNRAASNSSNFRALLADTARTATRCSPGSRARENRRSQRQERSRIRTKPHPLVGAPRWPQASAWAAGRPQHGGRGRPRASISHARGTQSQRSDGSTLRHLNRSAARSAFRGPREHIKRERCVTAAFRSARRRWTSARVMSSMGREVMTGPAG